MNEVIVTKENFDEEVRNFKGIPVLIDFWASWCGPCIMLSPVIEKIADEYDGKVKVCKINVDDQPELAAAFNVQNIPLLVVVKDGAITSQAVGVRPKEEIIEMLF